MQLELSIRRFAKNYGGGPRRHCNEPHRLTHGTAHIPYMSCGSGQRRDKLNHATPVGVCSSRELSQCQLGSRLETLTFFYQFEAQTESSSYSATVPNFLTDHTHKKTD